MVMLPLHCPFKKGKMVLEGFYQWTYSATILSSKDTKKLYAPITIGSLFKKEMLSFHSSSTIVFVNNTSPALPFHQNFAQCSNPLMCRLHSDCEIIFRHCKATLKLCCNWTNAWTIKPTDFHAAILCDLVVLLFALLK